MKKLVFLLGFGLMCAAASAKDGKGTSNLNIGVIPVGGVHLNVSPMNNNSSKKDDNGYKIDYNTLRGASLSYEYKMTNWRVMPELTYAQAKYDSHTRDDAAKFTLTGANSDCSIFSVMLYFGYTIKLDKDNRFQLPIYFGAGYEGMSPDDGNAAKMAGIGIGGKIRLKAYFTNKFGIFAGFAYRGGFGAGEKKDDPELGKASNYWHPEAGITFSF